MRYGYGGKNPNIIIIIISRVYKEVPRQGSSLVLKRKKVWESLEKKRRRSACVREEEDPRISVIHYSEKIKNTSYVSKT